MQCHASDLRAEVEQDWNELVEPGEGPPHGARCDALVHQAVNDRRRCPWRPAVQRLLEYAEKLTVAPSQMAEADVAALREAGWSDRAIHDAAQIASYFNYINRVADGLGVEPEAHLPRWGGTS